MIVKYKVKFINPKQNSDMNFYSIPKDASGGLYWSATTICAYFI